MKYWFRKRRGLMSRDLGWGWFPISIEGWLLIAGLITLLIELNNKIEGLMFWAWFIVFLFMFAFIADKKTERKVIFK